MPFIPVNLHDASDPAKAFRLAVESFRPEICPATREESRETLTKMRMAVANLELGMKSMPVLIVLVAMLNLFWTPWTWCLAWAVCALAAWAFSWKAARILLDEHGLKHDARTLIRTMLWRMGAFVLTYGMQGFVFYQPHDPVNQMCIILILIGSSTAAAMTAAWLPISVIQAVTYIGISITLFLTTGGPVYYALSLLAVFYALILMGMVCSMHAYSTVLLRLSQHKDTLIHELQRSNRIKSDFMANMSHELRTPMNAILGFSEVIKDEVMGPSNNPIYRAYAADIHTSGTHLLTLINSILDLSKIEAGKFELDDTPLDLHDIIEDAQRMVGLRASQKGLTLVNDIPRGIIVRADASAMRQVALNIASNAIKFTPSGGTIRTNLSMSEHAVAIRLQDTGCGIRPEDMDQVFESFGQGRHDIANQECGTGLGLPIARGLMRAHGGDLTMTSVLGTGTTVLASLPSSRIVRMPEELAHVNAA